MIDDASLAWCACIVDELDPAAARHEKNQALRAEVETGRFVQAEDVAVEAH